MNSKTATEKPVKRLVHSSDICTACLTCQMNCAYTFFKVNNPKKARLTIDRLGDTETRMTACVQCKARPCLKACPEGAIAEKGGFVRIDSKKCTSCGLCIPVCPYEGIKFHEDMGAIVCTQCGVCVKSCPVEALAMVGV